MISKKKFLASILAISLVAALAVGTTIAYLTDSTNTKTNTFTVGLVDIDLTETPNEGTDWTAKLVPNTTYQKDPTVKVEATSEPCWVFIKIDGKDKADTYLDYELNNNWKELTGHPGYYYYDGIQRPNSTLQILVNDEVTVKDIDEGEQFEFSFTAYAIQAQGFDTAADAWRDGAQSNW